MANQYPANEGLQVVYDSNSPPEVHHNYAETEALRDNGARYPSNGFNNDGPQVLEKPYGSIYNGALPKRRICGMSRIVAIAVFVVAGLLVIGAIVGGAVGGTMASRNASSASSTSPPQPTQTSGLLPLNCPGMNNTNLYVASNGIVSTFDILCRVDLPGTVTRQMNDTRQYTINGCVQSCADWNAAGSQPSCLGVTFGANLSLYTNVNCFMKNVIGQRVAYHGGDPQAAAVLLG